VMRKGFVRPLAAVLFAGGTAAFMLSASAEGQSGANDLRTRVEPTPGWAAARAFIASRIQKGFTPPKTPWGERSSGR
jgi:hypothetical protein